MNAPGKFIRHASHAGSWYSGDGKTLDSQISNWLFKAGGEGGDRLAARAIIAPHAGYSYSGATAAYAYKEINPHNVKRIFVLGPSHHVHIRGCALTSSQFYSTPLYDLIVDREITSELHSTGHFEWMSKQTDEDEHSLEMHLPYIAKVMESKKGQYSVVPVLVGSLTHDREKMYGTLFAKYLANPENLFIISSDFCHWGRRFSYSFYEESNGTISQHIEKLDRMGMDLIERLDSHAFHNYLKQYKNTICGRHPISLLLCTLDAMDKSAGTHSFRFLHYAQSNQCTSKNDSSVSYASGSLTIS